MGQPEVHMLTETSMKIERFSPQHQKGVEDLVLPIQNHEMGVKISREEQPDLIGVEEFFFHHDGNFWVALDHNSVIGTIGLADIGNRRFALRKMFVHKDHRGKEKGVSHSLLNRAFEWCREHEARTIYLGTTDKYLAAHRFYEKNGFVEISKEELPESFPLCHVDRIFYAYRF
jgi:N-acetylglutamate synthase-like GNAT family acetyltransferase